MDSGHTPAEANPFADGRGGSPNVFAIRPALAVARRVRLVSARWWFGDVGANGVEEIDLVTAPGDNFGWSAHEGPCEDDCEGVVQPVAWWEHEGTHPVPARRSRRVAHQRPRRVRRPAVLGAVRRIATRAS